MKDIKSSLIKVIKSGRPLNKEEIKMFESLSDAEQKELKELTITCSEQRDLEKVQAEFKKILKKAKKMQKENTDFVIPQGLTAGCELDFIKDPYSTAYNEAYVMIIQNPTTPKDVVELAKTNLLKNNIGLIQRVLNKFRDNNYEGKFTKDEVAQECKLSFFKAVELFNPNRNAKFSTFCTTVMHNEMVSLHTNVLNKLKQREEGFDEPVTSDSEVNNATKLDLYIDPTQESPEERCRKKAEIDLLYATLNQLTPEQKFVAYCRFGLNGVRKMTQVEIAEYMGMSQANVSKIESNLLVELKNRLEGRS